MCIILFLCLSITTVESTHPITNRHEYREPSISRGPTGSSTRDSTSHPTPTRRDNTKAPGSPPGSSLRRALN